MFARPSSSAYVCLRCHLRLTRQIPHPLSSTLPQRSPFSISSTHLFHSSPRPQWTDPLGQLDNNTEGDSRPRRRGKHYHPLGKLRGKKGGQQVRENAEALSVNSLGRPAEVIVLRDAPRDALEEITEQGDAEGATTGSSREALLNAIQGEDVPMDQDTVNQQIDALRPQVEDPNSGRLILPAKEYFRLCKVLTDSYSRPQLDAYMARSKGALPEEKSPDAIQNLLGLKHPEIHFRPWKAASKLDRIQKHLSLADTKSLRRVKRSRLASTLLQRCWKVEVAEEVERLGEILCTLPKAGIRLLTTGKPSYLDEIAENRQAKLEIDAPNVRIIADKDSAIYVLEDINRLWSLRHTEQFRLAMPASTSAHASGKDKRTPLVTFRPEDVALVSNLTRTTMTYANNSKRTAVAINGIGKDSVEDATRALLALVDIPSKRRTQTAFASSGNNDVVLQEISDLEGLPYRDRRTSFGRLCSPVPRTEITPLLPKPEPNYTESAGKVSTPDTHSVEDQGTGSNTVTISTNGWLNKILMNAIQPSVNALLVDDKLWNATADVQVSASLGLVIHSKSSASTSRITPAPSDPSDNASFLHRVPGLSQVLPHLIWNREKVIDVLSFRLVHNPWKQPGPTLPEIRLDFDINSLSEDERSTKFKGLYALTKDRRGQVMLPSQAVDLCFKKKKTFHAKIGSLESQPDVKQFIEQTKANILDGSGTLRAPSSVLIHVPFAVVEPATVTPMTEATKKARKNATPPGSTRTLASEKFHCILPETVDKMGILAQYYFIGVEHLQIAGYTFEGYPVRYTSIEAGKLGGKYGDLEILMPTPDGAEEMTENRMQKESAAQRKAFTEVALKLVHLVDKAAHGKLERPGPVTQPSNAEIDIDHEGMERWTPEHLNPTPWQPSAGHEDKVGGTEKRPGDELSESGRHHATIITATDADISSLVNLEDLSTEAPHAINHDEAVQPIETTSEECPPNQAQSTIKPLDAAENEAESETDKPEQRVAASG